MKAAQVSKSRLVLSFLPGPTMQLLNWLNSVQKNAGHSRRKSPRRWSQSPAESLEQRRLLTTFTTDVDGDGMFSPLTDGITAFRYLSGQTGESLVAGSVSPEGRRTDPDEIVAFLDSPEMQRVLDLDGDGILSPLTDGVLLIRGLSGTSGDDLTSGAANPNGTRSEAKHIEFVIEAASNIDDTFSANEGEVLQVSAADGVRQNDPLTSSIVEFEALSTEGATVVLAADGSFTYDPTTSTMLSGLSAADQVSDSFTYTIELSGSQAGVQRPVTVNVSVLGQTSGSQVFLSTDDNTAIGSINFPKGEQPSEPESLLTNDEGEGLTVVDYDRVSELGGQVIIAPDGKWNFNPTNSDTLNQLAPGESTLDRFTYTTEDSVGLRRETEVVVEVAGENDAPVANVVRGEIVYGEVIELSPLNFVNDPEAGDTLSLVSVHPSPRLRIGEPEIIGDGMIRYDSTIADRDILSRLPEGHVYPVQLVYVVEDQHGETSSGEIVVRVTGAAHAPVAVDDNVTSRQFTNGAATAVYSVLANDTDVDENDIVLVSSGSITTTKGATVTMSPDGTFVFDPSTSSELLELTKDQTARDSFSYTINDSEGHGESTATVFFDVVGVDFRNRELDLSVAQVENNGTHVVLLGPDDYGGRVIVFDHFGGNLLLDLAPDEVDTITITGTPLSDVIWTVSDNFPVTLILDGKAGNDVLVGGGQSDTITGGPGDDIIYGDAGVNILNGGAGDDQYRDAGQNVIEDLLGSNWHVPKLNQTPSPADLQEVDPSGDLTISLTGFPERAATNVIVTGPSGYGFELTGDWSVTAASNGGETFTGTNVEMITAFGAMPLGDVTLNVGRDQQSVFGTGPFESASGGLFNATNLLLNNPVINEINEWTGLDFNSNLLNDTDFSFGLKLGSELTNETNGELKNFDAPLNPAVPYLFATWNPEPDQVVSLGDVVISPSDARDGQFALVIDPVDPFFWINGEYDGKGGAIGWSYHGMIPFSPTKRPDAIAASEQIYGNIHGRIKFPFKKVFELEGEAVLDYDRGYGPGQGYEGDPDESIQADQFVELITGQNTDWQDVVDVVTDTEFGVNGKVTFNPEIKKTDLTLSIPIADGTAMFVNGTTVAFRGGTPDKPFGDSGSILNHVLGSLGKIDVDGSLDFSSGNFHLDVEARSGGLKIGPFQMAGNRLDFEISNKGVDFSATIDTPVGSFSFDADITFEETSEELSIHTIITKPGVFRFNGRAETPTLDLGIVSFNARAALSLHNQQVSFNGDTFTVSPGPVQLELDLSGSADLGIVEFTGDLDVNISSTGSFSGSGKIAAIPFVGPNFSLSVTVTNSGISFTLLGWDITIPIPLFLHVDHASGTPAFATERLVSDSLPAIVDEAIRRLENNGLRSEEVDLLKSAQFRVASLTDETGALGFAAGNSVTIDDNAAGYGWFVDATPRDDDEFSLFTNDALLDREAHRRIDLLSVVMHELTHVLERAFPQRDFRFGEVGGETLRVGHRFTVGDESPGFWDQLPVNTPQQAESFTDLDDAFEDLMRLGLE